MSQEIHRFEDFELDPSVHELRCNGRVIHLERIPFEFLCLLLERSGQIVTRGEIAERVWGKGVFIDSVSSINTAMRKIRRALNDDSDPPKFVATIPAKGYRFMVSVHTLNGELKTNNSEWVQVPANGASKGRTQENVQKSRQIGAWSASVLAIIATAIVLVRYDWLHPPKRSSANPSLGRPMGRLPDKPSLAVLPFVNLSGDAEQDYLIDGISDDLVNALFRLTNIFVIARTSSFTYKGKAIRAPDIRRELRVKYLLEGSVRKAGESVKVNTQLVDAATGRLLWAGRYDRSLHDLFALQNEIMQNIVTTLSDVIDGMGEAHDSCVVLPTAAGRRSYDPADFGAVADDGIDDSIPSQQALDAASLAGGQVCFGPGRWRLSRAPAGTYNRLAALSIHGAHVEIQGVGPQTVLEVVGDQNRAAMGVISINPGSHDITIRDLTIETSETTNTNEQFHAIDVGNGIGTGIIEDVRIEHVRFEHPDATDGSRKGDCLHIVGNTPQSAVRGVTVVGVTFTRCAHSDVAIQKNVFDLIIQGNQFTQSSDING